MTAAAPVQRDSRWHPRAAGDAGVALVELLVGMVLIAVVAGLATDAIVSALRSQTYLSARATDLDGLRQAMQRTTRDIRQGSVSAAGDNSLTVSVPTATGTRAITWSAAGSTFAETIVDTPTGGQPGAPRQVTVLSNFDAHAPGTIFGYLAYDGYAPTTTGAVDNRYCSVIARPGTYEPRCVGTVTIHLSATVPNHPDLDLTDTVAVRNAGT